MPEHCIFFLCSTTRPAPTSLSPAFPYPCLPFPSDRHECRVQNKACVKSVAETFDHGPVTLLITTGIDWLQVWTRILLSRRIFACLTPSIPLQNFTALLLPVSFLFLWSCSMSWFLVVYLAGAGRTHASHLWSRVFQYITTALNAVRRGLVPRSSGACANRRTCNSTQVELALAWWQTSTQITS